MYIVTRFLPRFCDSDAAGHVNNTAVTQWLEAGRTDLYANYMPSDVHCMMRRLELDYDREMTHTQEVEIRTGTTKLGTKSVTLCQEVWQGGVCRARALVVDCWYDPATRTAAPVPEHFRRAFSAVMFAD